MKKNYEKPTMTVVKMESSSVLLSGSGVMNQEYGIGWGGIDEEGLWAD